MTCRPHAKPQPVDRTNFQNRLETLARPSVLPLSALAKESERVNSQTPNDD